MPIFFQQDIDADTKLAVWKIEEEEAFFTSEVPLQREITHPHKRLQHLAGRYLLKYLFPGFPVALIQLADTRKPFLENEAYHFSISHSVNYAAALVSKTNRVGVDIETISGKASLIAHKYLSDADKETMQTIGPADTDLLNTLLWSCKEAVFKWEGKGGMDFREHMQLVSLVRNEKTFESVMLLKKGEPIYLDINSHLFHDSCLSYVIT